MTDGPDFPPHLLAIIRKYRVSNATLAAVLKVDRTTISKKLNSHRGVSIQETELLCQFFKRVFKLDIDRAKVMRG